MDVHKELFDIDEDSMENGAALLLPPVKKRNDLGVVSTAMMRDVVLDK